MSIEDIQYIQELEHRIEVLENDIGNNIDLFTIIFLVISIALFIGSIVTMCVMFNVIKKYG